MILSDEQGQLAWASAWPLTLRSADGLQHYRQVNLTFPPSVISVSPSSVYEGQCCFWWKRLFLSFLVGDTLFWQGQGL